MMRTNWCLGAFLLLHSNAAMRIGKLANPLMMRTNWCLGAFLLLHSDAAMRIGKIANPAKAKERADKVEELKVNRARRDAHRSFERRDNGTDRNASVIASSVSSDVDLIILEFPKSGRTWLYGLLHDATVFQGSNKSIVRSHTNGIIDHPFLMTPESLTSAFSSVPVSRRFPSMTILLIRDPLDVMVSGYFERMYRAKGSKGLGPAMQLETYAKLHASVPRSRPCARPKAAAVGMRRAPSPPM